MHVLMDVLYADVSLGYGARGRARVKAELKGRRVRRWTSTSSAGSRGAGDVTGNFRRDGLTRCKSEPTAARRHQRSRDGAH